MSKKSILAETLAEIQQIKEGIEKNANHVLKNTLKDDLEEIVRKGLNEAEVNEEFPKPDDVADDNGISADQNTLGGATEELPGKPELPVGGMGGEENPVGDIPLDPTATSSPIDSMETGMEPEIGEPEVIDLTDKTDDEVIQHFNLINPADEIEIVQTPEGGIQITLNPSTGANPEGGLDGIGGDLPPTEEPTDIPGLEPGMGGGEEIPAEEPGVESGEEGGEEKSEDEPEEKKKDDDEEESVEEDVNHVNSKAHMKHAETGGEPVEEDVNHVTSKAHLKHAMTGGETVQNAKELQESLVKTRTKIQALMAENKNKTDKLDEMSTLVESFKSQETEYKSAIKGLKGYLQEVALYTSNLSFIVKLLSENSTTKDEKLDIIKRFDSAKNLSESREVFNNLSSLFTETKKSVEKTINERVLTNTITSGSSTINESTAYKNPQLDRIKEIMGINK